MSKPDTKRSTTESAEHLESRNPKQGPARRLGHRNPKQAERQNPDAEQRQTLSPHAVDTHAQHKSRQNAKSSKHRNAQNTLAALIVHEFAAGGPLSTLNRPKSNQHPQKCHERRRYSSPAGRSRPLRAAVALARRCSARRRRDTIGSNVSAR